MLVVFAGLPGSGKTTVARVVAAKLEATYLRVDAIEAALWRAGISRREPTGLAAYFVANVVAEASLVAGGAVVVDAVNAVEAARQGWRTVASQTGKPLRVVEVVCSDVVEHRRRVEERTSDLDGHTVPTWAEVEAREYEPWHDRHLVVDTALETQAGALKRILSYLAG